MVIGGTKKGLGIRIVGGRTMKMDTEGESYFGIFIKEVIHNSLAEKEGMVYLSVLVRNLLLFFAGTLKRGDQLLEANGQNLVGVSNERY